VRIIIVRASDVPTYVQYGAADIGIAGKDVLLEHGGAGSLPAARPEDRPLPPDGRRPPGRIRLRIRQCAAVHASRSRPSTCSTAREHFAAKGVHVDLIKLYGSMELAPLVGCRTPSSTSFQQRQHAEGEQSGRGRGHHADIRSRLIVNQASLKLKRDELKFDDSRRSRAFRRARRNECCHDREPAGFPRRGFHRVRALLAFDASPTPASKRPSPGSSRDVRRAVTIAVLEYTRRFDRLDVASMVELETVAQRSSTRLAGLVTNSGAMRSNRPRARIRLYHERQPQASWQYTDEDGTLLGQKVTPLDRVGVYVPGGKAAYPSTVLMNTIPAKVAGVGEVIMVVPTPDGERNPLVLAAAAVAGVDRVFTIGGAQAVGALAYGTHRCIPQVDKIVGPGNAYVAAAKRQVFGVVGIDMVAGPSEMLDDQRRQHANPDWVAMDLFSQAEHDEVAQSMLLCTGRRLSSTAVARKHDRLLGSMSATRCHREPR
jgi:hypothetical protein